MDPQKKLVFGGVGLLVLAGLSWLMISRNTGDSPVEAAATTAVQIPDLNKTEITEVQITRPSANGPATTVTLVKRGQSWHVSSPVDYPADSTAITTMLDKLDTLEMVDGSVSSQARFHTEMEVDDAHGLHVVAKAGTRVLADFIVGAYRSNNTLVRLSGQNGVASVEGSIKYAFDRDVKDWREKLIHTMPQDQINSIAFTGPISAGHGVFSFERPTVTAPPSGDAGATTTLGDWRVLSASYLPAPPPEGAGADAGTKAPRRPSGIQTTIPNFASSRLQSVLSSLADLRCSDFAATGVTPAQAGIGAASPRVTLTTNATPAVSTTLILGNAQGADFYLMKEGDPTVFVVTSYVRDRVAPALDLFVQDPATAANTAPPPPPDMGAMGMGGPGGMGGAGGGNLPPEVMAQIQAQLAAQGHGASAGH